MNNSPVWIESVSLHGPVDIMPAVQSVKVLKTGIRGGGSSTYFSCHHAGDVSGGQPSSLSLAQYTVEGWSLVDEQHIEFCGTQNSLSG